MTQVAERAEGCLIVTGALGFLGSEIIRQARVVGLPVRGVGRHDPKASGVRDYWRADILDAERLRPSMEGVDTVIHAAGLAHVFDKSRATNTPFALVNETGTEVVASVAAKVGVRHFVFISSVAVYGHRNAGEPRDEASPCFPEGPYAESKMRAERRAAEIAEHSGMRLTILRLTTLYGEGDPGNIARLVRLIDLGRFVWVGDGQNRKNLLYRGDAARACLQVIGAPQNGIETYNVSGPPCTVRELVVRIAGELGRPLPHWRVPGWLVAGMVRFASRFAAGRGLFGTAEAGVRKWLSEDVYDSSKFEQAFDFLPNVDLAEGIRREVVWYRQSSQGATAR